MDFLKAATIIVRGRSGKYSMHVSVYLSVSIEQSPPWEADSRSVGQEFPAFYRLRMFIAFVTRSRHWTQPWVTWIQSVPSSYLYLRHILMLSSQLFLSLPSGLFLASFVYIYHHPVRSTYPAHLIFLHLMILIVFGEEYKRWSSSVCSFLHVPATSLLRSKIFLSTLSSNTIDLVALGGVVVSVLATGPKVRGFKPYRGRWILRVIKSVARLPSEGK
jgi:hypothetical protein